MALITGECSRLTILLKAPFDFAKNLRFMHTIARWAMGRLLMSHAGTKLGLSTRSSQGVAAAARLQRAQEKKGKSAKAREGMAARQEKQAAAKARKGVEVMAALTASGKPAEAAARGAQALGASRGGE